MPRRLRALSALLLVAFTFAVAACADSTAPRPVSHISADNTCDQNSNNTCKH